MAPRPFPFQLGVGIDICRITRIVALLRQESTRNRWARRVFTRLEWMALCRRFERVNQLQAGEPVEQKMINYQQSNQENQDAPEGIKNPEKDLLMLPKLSNLSSVFEDTEAYTAAIGDARSPLGSLARHLAGRLDYPSIVRRLFSLLSNSLSIDGQLKKLQSKRIAIGNFPCKIFLSSYHESLSDHYPEITRLRRSLSQFATPSASVNA